MRLLHFSDVHVSAEFRDVPIHRWVGKRGLAGLNLLLGRGKRFSAAPEKLRALARFAQEQKFDAVLFTGDYTALGLEREFRAAREAVEPLMHAPAGYVNVPGNHDLYLPEVLPRSGPGTCEVARNRAAFALRSLISSWRSATVISTASGSSR